MPDVKPQCAPADIRPVPDPTKLTTEALQRAVSTASEITALRIAHEAEMREADNGHLHQIINLHADLEKEKLNAVDRELQLGERQRVEQKTDTKLAVDAALIAQKELFREQSASAAAAIAKSENAALEQMKTMNQTFSMALESERRVSNDLKERLNLDEQALAKHTAGQTGESGGREKTQVSFLNVALLLIAVGSLIVTFAH